MIKHIFSKFTKHPHSIGESYGRHCLEATKLGLCLMRIVICLFIHAVFPFLFVTYARDQVGLLHDRLIKRNPPEEAI
ncbi:MAG: DUF6356 family protein [Pseudomonadota bacterium]